MSLFHQTFGYYAHGVDDTTATLPAGWTERLIRVHNENTANAIGWCIEVHDLAISKLVAGREKDMAFLRVLLREKMAEPAVLRQRVDTLPVSQERVGGLQTRLRDLELACQE